MVAESGGALGVGALETFSILFFYQSFCERALQVCLNSLVISLRRNLVGFLVAFRA